MATKIISFGFYLIFFLTPLIWTPLNYELFEYNKMVFVYLLTVIITGAWVWKMLNTKKLILKKTPLDIPILLFLGANIISSIFSIDPHTSIWGYYSRSNGGLLSIISYILLYYALVSNFEAKHAFKFLKSAIFGGVVVALYAIPEHFGVSPSCVFLTGQATANCWVQDVQARIFATLGQPNWLASYMGMLIFPTIYFYLTANNFRSRILYLLSLISFYLAFTFTYSRGATLGFLGGLIILLLLIVIQNLRSHPGGVNLKLIARFKPILLVLALFTLVNLFFGSALTGSFRLFKEAAPPPRPVIGSGSIPQSTQLETGGTESGQIRLIVWRGALEIFKHYPVFGSGVETFAYSYYNFRPKEHNLVSEWDFLYNKAHNEYLNYLATTGLVGFLSYLAVILSFLVYSIRYTVLKKAASPHTPYPILHTVLLASYISYIVQNFFGFSVVIIALLFFLFPALAILNSDSAKIFVLPKNLHTIYKILNTTIYRRPLFTKVTLFLLGFIVFYLVFTITRFWIADTLFSRGTNYSNSGNPGRAYNELIDAVSLNPGEPFYKNELGYAAASAALALSSDDATLSASLKDLGVRATEDSLNISPKNVSFWRTAIRTYYILSDLDPSFNQKTLDTLDKTISLAPTDAKLYYNKGLILSSMDKNEQALEALKQATSLKPNYRDAYFTLGVVYEALGKNEEAINQMETVLKIIPNDPDALKKLEELRKA